MYKIIICLVRQQSSWKPLSQDAPLRFCCKVMVKNLSAKMRTPCAAGTEKKKKKKENKEQQQQQKFRITVCIRGHFYTPSQAEAKPCLKAVMAHLERHFHDFVGPAIFSLLTPE